MTDALRSQLRTWELFPLDQIRYDLAHTIAFETVAPYALRGDRIEDFLRGGQGSHSPTGLNIQVGSLGAWFTDEQASTLPPGRKAKPDDITVWWSHDPEKRIFRFKVRNLWKEATQGVRQMALMQAPLS